jgi:hypothetical protein
MLFCGDVEIRELIEISGVGGRFSMRKVTLCWNHLLVQNPHDPNPVQFQSVKHDVSSLLVPAKSCTDCFA